MDGHHYRVLFFAWFFSFCAIALIGIGLGTDVWYTLESDKTNTTIDHQKYNLNYGLWRTCFHNVSVASLTPYGVDSPMTVCVWKTLERISKGDKDYEVAGYLTISVWSLLVASGGVLLLVHFLVMFGFWPHCCCSCSKRSLSIGIGLLAFLAGLAGVASLVCFIALQGIERERFPSGVSGTYGWSFMVSWVGTGLVIIASFMYLFLGCVIREYDYGLSRRKNSKEKMVYSNNSF